MTDPSEPLRTPDGRYLVFSGSKGPRLWRASNPSLAAEERDRFTKALMSARRAIRDAESAEALFQARHRVHAAKIALGERGPVWWDDGEPDLNRRLVAGSPYATWYEELKRGSGN